MDLENLCQIIQEKLFDIPLHPRGLLSDLEVCIGGIDSITSASASVTEISLSKETILAIGKWLGNEERVQSLVHENATNASCGDLDDQLFRDGMLCVFIIMKLKYQGLIIHFVMVFVCVYIYIGGIPLPVFSEWWLAKEKFSTIHVFIQSSFPGAIFQGCNGLSVKYQVVFLLFVMHSVEQ